MKGLLLSQSRHFAKTKAEGVISIREALGGRLKTDDLECGDESPPWTGQFIGPQWPQ